MDADEQVDIVKRLEESRDVLIQAVRGVSDETAAVRRTPDRWSIAECVEHVAMVECSMLALIREEFTPLDAALDTREREAKLLRWGPNRTRRFEAPARARPTGRDRCPRRWRISGTRVGRASRIFRRLGDDLRADRGASSGGQDYCAVNTVNNPSFGYPGVTLGTSQFGKVSNTRNAGRQAQPAVKIHF